MPSWNTGNFDRRMDEAIKRKYDIMQQEVDAKQTEALARQRESEAQVPLLQAQAEHYGGLNQTNRYIHELTAEAENKRTAAQSPLWTAQAGREDALAKAQNFETGMMQELRPDLIAHNRAASTRKRLEAMAASGAYSQDINTLISRRNKMTGESNPMIAQYGHSGLKWGAPISSTAGTDRVAQMKRGQDLRNQLAQQQAEGSSFMDIDTDYSRELNKWSPTGVGAVDWLARRGRNILNFPSRLMAGGAYYLAEPRNWEE